MGYIKPEGIEEVWAEQLAQSRWILKTEMQNVLHCQTPQEKRELYERWQVEYSELMVKDLVKCAKDKQSRLLVAKWDLGNFDFKRRKRHERF